MRHSPTVFESSEIATAEPDCIVYPFDPYGLDPRTLEPTSHGLLLPPPYCAWEGDNSSLAPPTEGKDLCRVCEAWCFLTYIGEGNLRDGGGGMHYAHTVIPVF